MIADRLKARRLELRMTQKALADRLRVSELTVINWEKARTEPSAKSTAAVMRFLGDGAATDPMCL